MNASKVRQSIQESINKIRNEDFLCESGFSYKIILDPAEARVYTCLIGDNAVPRQVYNHTQIVLLSVNSGAIATSVANELENCLNDIEDLIAAYQGSEWDGNNWRGSWAEEANCLLENIAEKIEIAYYWQPEDWFEPVINQLKDKWRLGLGAVEIINSEDLGDEVNGMCDRDQAIAWLLNQIEEWETEDEE